jgi:heme exporter protein A
MGLTVADLSCSRAGRPVLDGVGFALEGGAALVVRGPNGAGKSTLLRALAGLLRVDAGTVALDGVAPADADAWAELVAYAGHLDAVKPQLTVAENLRFWARLYGGGGVAAALEGFGLAAIADRPVQFVSAGQRRRAGLARLLLAPRKLWLLDEPTVGLDEAAAGRLAEVVQRHCAAGGIAVIATHAALELPGARTLRLAPLAAGAGGGDPFLAGSWA